MYDEYIDRVGEVVTGIVQQAGDRNNVLVDLGKVEALLPRSEQVDGERYEQGSRIKAVITEVRTGTKGPQVILSRRDPELIKTLFELEVPEIADGLVEIRGVAREPGYRSKIAVESHAQGVDPVGACVGPRGSRVRMVVSELRGEKIDIIPWNPEPARFVAKALSPARVREVYLDDEATRGDRRRPRRPARARDRQGGHERPPRRAPDRLEDRHRRDTEFAQPEAEAAFGGEPTRTTSPAAAPRSSRTASAARTPRCPGRATAACRRTRSSRAARGSRRRDARTATRASRRPRRRGRRRATAASSADRAPSRAVARADERRRARVAATAPRRPPGPSAAETRRRAGADGRRGRRLRRERRPIRTLRRLRPEGAAARAPALRGGGRRAAPGAARPAAASTPAGGLPCFERAVARRAFNRDAAADRRASTGAARLYTDARMPTGPNRPIRPRGGGSAAGRQAPRRDRRRRRRRPAPGRRARPREQRRAAPRQRRRASRRRPVPSPSSRASPSATSRRRSASRCRRSSRF